MSNDETYNPTEDWTRILRSRYRSQLSEIQREYPHKKSLIIDYREVERAGAEGIRLADELLDNPGKVIEDIIYAIQEEAFCIDSKNKPLKINIRFVNLPRRKPVRLLRVEDINTFISIEGMIQKVTAVEPRISEAVFRCPAGHFTTKLQGYRDFKEPESCGTDGCTFKKLDLIPKRSTFVNTQKVRIIEAHENLRGGEQPQSLDLDITDDLVGQVMIGDRVVVNGTLRAIQKTAHGEKSPIFHIYLEVNSFELTEKEFDDIELTSDVIDKILEFSQRPHVMDLIVSSIAPSIYGLDRIKQSLALQLFGGVPQILPDGTTIRGDIHVLLIGDPGVAKSKLLSAIDRIAPRCIMTTGTGSSAAGLTATAVKDDFGEGRWTLEAGAFILADRGQVIVDEVEKMEKKDRNAILTALEQQEVTINKAGINATMKSRCCMTAAANPKMGRFDPMATLSDQIELEPPFLSRMDLIFTIRDVPDKEKDKAIAKHILKSHKKTQDETIVPAIDPTFMKQYIAYARKTIKPELSPEAEDRLVDFYVKIRNPNNGRTDGSQGIPATPRQFEALVRMAQASAKSRLSPVATADDADLVIAIETHCLKEVAYDEKTGTFDISKIQSNVSAGMVNNIRIMEKAITELKNPESGRTAINLIYAGFKDTLDTDQVDSILNKMSALGKILYKNSDREVVLC